MRKQFILPVLFLLTSLLSFSAYAGSGNFAIGGGPVGNLFVVDSRPEMTPGVGGHVYFDYRWSPQLSTTITILVTTEDGTGPDRADKGIEFLGMPSFDIKYYFINRTSRWDPYIHTGIGWYVVTEGSVNNGTMSMGLGANLGVGFDYYLNDTWSVGLGMAYRSIGLIESFGGPGTAVFPLTLNGQVAFHF